MVKKKVFENKLFKNLYWLILGNRLVSGCG